jgi:hypothetical protein
MDKPLIPHSRSTPAYLSPDLCCPAKWLGLLRCAGCCGAGILVDDNNVRREASTQLASHLFFPNIPDYTPFMSHPCFFYFIIFSDWTFRWMRCFFFLFGLFLLSPPKCILLTLLYMYSLLYTQSFLPQSTLSRVFLDKVGIVDE